MQANPWSDIPAVEPYIPACDIDAITRYHSKVLDERFVFQTQVLPEPYAGHPSAPVYFLNQNPSYDDTDLVWHHNEKFSTALRDNLVHKITDMPFYFLDMRFRESGGAKYWSSKLRWLIDATGVEAVSRGIFTLEYIGYHSYKYKKNPEKAFGNTLETQMYAANLVKNAITEKKTIVVMRAKNEWFQLVKELRHYEKLHTLNSPQNVSVSPNNLPAFDNVVKTVLDFN